MKAISVVNPGALGMDELFSGEAATVSKAALVDILSAYSAANSDNVDEEIQGLNRYRASVWIHAAVSAISRNLAKFPVVVSRKTPDGGTEDVEDSPVSAIVDKSIGQLDEDHFVETASLYMALAGSGPIELIRTHEDPEDPTGEIDRLRPVMPSRLKADPGKTRGDAFIRRFLIDVEGEEIPIHRDNIAFPRFPDPQNPFVGLAPVTVLARTAMNEELAEIYNHDILEQSGTPNLFKHTGDQPLDPGTAKATEHSLGVKIRDRNGRPVVLPHNLEPVSSTTAPKDLLWVEMMGMSKEKILAVFGTPPLVVMDLSDSSVLQNTSEQRIIFKTQTLEYYSAKILRALNRVIFPQYGVFLRHAWEQAFDNITVLQRREQARLDFQANIVTRNEARASGAEFDTREDESGDEYHSDAAASATQNPFALSYAKSVRGKMRAPFSDEVKKFAAASAKRQQDVTEPEVLREIRRALRDQAERVVAALKRREEQIALIGEKSVNKIPIFPHDLLSELFNTVEEAAAFREQLGPVFIGSMTSAGEDKLATHLDGSLIQAIQDGTNRYRQAFDSIIANDIQRITESTRSQVIETLRNGFDRGLGSQGVIGEISKLFDGWASETGGNAVSRAERIARTETTTLLNSGAHAATLAVEDNGGQFVKSWLSFRDSLVRDDHREMDSRYSASPIPLKARFEAPDGSSLMYPGDPTAPAAQRVNCRCTQIERLIKSPSMEPIL